MSGSVGGMGVPRCGTSLSMRSSAGERPKRTAALLARGLTSFIWPRSAPTTSTGDMPPISSVICFQLQPFSRLMSRIFSGELFASHGTPLGLPAWEKERLLGRAVECGNGSGRAAHRPGQRDYAAASTHERLIDKV